MNKTYTLDFNRALPRGDGTIEVQFIWREERVYSAQELLNSVDRELEVY